ncbi:unnamed protein product [Nesidiocoris tenuis]|uniref:Uncharacterized protein n=1 Tax=Nesidiocoris tenuis TaxID=355587 RepID=A0A6H5FWM6_9HEMI|nr:unnamed protein product [Nesidiocoris tenuis]
MSHLIRVINEIRVFASYVVLKVVFPCVDVRTVWTFDNLGRVAVCVMPLVAHNFTAQSTLKVYRRHSIENTVIARCLGRVSTNCNRCGDTSNRLPPNPNFDFKTTIFTLTRLQFEEGNHFEVAD